MKISNRTKKIMVSSITIIICIIMMMPTFALLDPGKYDGDRGTTMANSAGEITRIILAIVQTVAMITAVVMLIWLGGKYMMASPDGKAEIKKSIPIYIIGAVLLFAATGVVQLIKTFAGQTVGNGESGVGTN